MSAGGQVLIVEDEFLLAAELIRLLRCHGFAIVGPAARLSDARVLAQTAHIDAAVLDVCIRGGDSVPVAEALAARAIPFLFVTGYSSEDLRAYAWAAPILRKPLEQAELLQQLLQLLARNA